MSTLGIDIEVELSRIRAESETMLASIRIEAEERLRSAFEARRQLAAQLQAAHARCAELEREAEELRTRAHTSADGDNPGGACGGDIDAAPITGQQEQARPAGAPARSPAARSRKWSPRTAVWVTPRPPKLVIKSACT